ncbi:MAG: hypothetical protein MUF49_19925 [Oculatellaceae cyanobacterium Prado106]|nr:hypothetical protein [Oculatellaceae cyanobacterium Prado106]
MHADQPGHAGIIVCKDDADREKMAARIHDAIAPPPSLAGQLIRVNRQV